MIEATIPVGSADELVMLLGASDQHLRRIRDSVPAKISARDGKIHVSGDEQAVLQATEIIEQIKNSVSRDGAVSPEQVTHIIKQVTGFSGSFTADLPDTIDKYWYELQLKATDSTGVSATKSVLININYVQGGGGSPCTLKTTDPSVTICSPAANSTVSSPVHIVAGSTNTAGVTNMKIYIDGVSKYSIASNKIDTSLALPNGTHRLTVQSSDKLGRFVNETRYFTVGTTTSCTVKTTDPSITICSPAAGATVKSPVHLVAKTTNSSGIVALAVYVDNVLALKTTSNQIDTNLTMAVGTRFIVVQSWDNAGRIIKEPRTITVSP